MLVTCRQMQELEERAFSSGVQAENLMETAGIGIAEVLRHFFPKPGTLVLYLGSGNNGGDAMVAARGLIQEGWQVKARTACAPEKMKPLPQQHWQHLTRLGMEPLTEPLNAPFKRPLVLLDGLLGIGAKGPLRPALKELAAEMNSLRQSHGAFTVAMDIPSGLNGDTGSTTEEAVMADITATVAVAKKGLVADAAINHVGRLALGPLPELTTYLPKEQDTACLLTPELLQAWIPQRRFDFHKGQAGRVGVIAGSRGFFGAAEMVCRGALRAGAGLVTLLVKPEAFDLLATRVPAEVMVKSVDDYRQALDLRFDTLAIGPGLGFDHEKEYLEVIQKTQSPAVLDADALTAISKLSVGFINACAAHHLLTPHPGEMTRLMPGGTSMPRREQAEKWALEQPGHTLLLKGARTVIATQGRPTCFNTTGHPGMASGGMGDVLTGVSAALLGQGLPGHHAAGLAAWICGRAAEMHAVNQAPVSTLPSDVISFLGTAWAELEGRL